MPFNGTCLICGSAFYARPAKIRAGTAKYCSTACRDVARKSFRVERTCEHCGQTVAVVACYANRGQYRFCSRACYDAARAPTPKPAHPTRDQNFDAQVLRTEGCWEWTGWCYPRNGYGQCGSGKHGVGEYAHRRAWERASGKSIPDGLGIFHVCDNPPCVRNDDEGTYEVAGVLLPRWGHLFMGTSAANAADKVAKGRQLKGEQIHNSRLTEAIAIEIRQRYTGERGEIAALAHEYGENAYTIADLVRGRTWRHLKQPDN